MVEAGWTPTDIEEPAATSPSTVGRHYDSARLTADDGWTPMGVEQRAATSPSTVGINTPGQPDRWLDIDGHSLSMIRLLLLCISL